MIRLQCLSPGARSSVPMGQPEPTILSDKTEEVLNTDLAKLGLMCLLILHGGASQTSLCTWIACEFFSRADSDAVGLGGGLRLCICNKLPSDARLPGPRTTLRAVRPWWEVPYLTASSNIRGRRGERLMVWWQVGWKPGVGQGTQGHKEHASPPARAGTYPHWLQCHVLSASSIRVSFTKITSRWHVCREQHGKTWCCACFLFAFSRCPLWADMLWNVKKEQEQERTSWWGSSTRLTELMNLGSL